MSRVALIICGVALLAAVIVPLQSYYDGNYDKSMEDAADSLTFILDGFWASEADTLTIRGWEILPSSDSYVEIEGHSLTIHLKDKSYRSLISHSMEQTFIGHDDEVTITKS
jgi:hypothetical protein